MNTKNLKAYAPKARAQFIEAIKKRAAQLGIYADRIAEVQIEGSAAIIEGRVFTAKQGQQQKRLAKRVSEKGYDLFVREMSYTWFNRLAAIRYMELHDYLDHGFRVLSNPNNPDSLPEILDHASDVVGTLDPDAKYLDKNHIIELQLAGDKEEELYRELLLGQCHRLHNIMPFMFEAIDDATELLLPDNLTKTDSILKGLVNEIPEEDWSEIEVIGWLYQFYISEHKDAVIGKVVKSEDIPAATQLFTPNWIVKYLVQNSLGRQWLATYPESDLKGKMEYYIEPAEQTEDVIEQLKAITPTSIDPEQIKVLDPAAGSGHILVEVYEVLREIYLERGYRLREIPELILTKNIFGLDIDDRAAQLAGFALMMKAREDDRRIFERVERGEVQLNVYSLQSTEGLDITELWQALDLEGNQQQGSTGGLFDEPEEFVSPTGIYAEYFKLLQTLKSAFLQAKTLGSLIPVDNQNLQNLVALKERLEAKEQSSDPSTKQVASELLPIVNQAITLALKYDVVVANPPYMGIKGMNVELKDYVNHRYQYSKSDLFSIYIERCLEFGKHNAELGLVTPYVWMFISSFEDLRTQLLTKHSLNSLIQLEYNSFAPACIPVCTFTISKTHISNYVGSYIRLSEFKGHEYQAPKALEAIKKKNCDWFYNFKPDEFSQIPGSPIAYWALENTFDLFKQYHLLNDVASPRAGLATGDNTKFQRHWHEVDNSSISFKCESNKESSELPQKWYPCHSGGQFRRWYGNHDIIVNWQFDGNEIRNFKHPDGRQKSRPQNTQFFFKEGITWTKLSSTYFAARYRPKGFVFDDTGRSAFCSPKFEGHELSVLSTLNSPVATETLGFLNPTMSFTSGDVAKIPYNPSSKGILSSIAQKIVDLYKQDWDYFERSWEFKSSPLVNTNKVKLFEAVEYAINEDSEFVNLVEKYEIENVNSINSSYNYDSSFSSEMLTLNRNLNFRYNKSKKDFSSIVQSDYLCELISYTVGCSMGRYSLDRDSLIYARSGNEGFKELVAEGVYQSFPADDDGIVPLASEDWLFDDDATARFREFVKAVWGDEHLQENLEFVAESLCLHALKAKKGESAMDTVRRYFSTQFFKDHCKTYKKRPIYWLFSSGKEKAFECLVYLHRYNEGTLSRMRTEYVTPLMGKYDAQHSSLAEQKMEATTEEARRIEKELKGLEKKQAELRGFDEQLKHYAEKRITLDLDDGVKANYGKFGNLLADVKAIHDKAVK